MFKKKEPLIILILAVLVATFMGFLFGLPLRIATPVLCIQMIGASCLPRINLVNAFFDFLFWFIVLTAGWWVLKIVLKKIKKKK